MKFNKIAKLTKISVFLLIILINTALGAKIKTGFRTNARFSFSQVHINVINGDDEANFKSSLSLIKEGILIEPVAGINEQSLKLISEKTEDEAFMIDYRLLRSCEGIESEDKDNVYFTLSPKSLENRTSNENLQLKLTFKRDKNSFEKLFDDRKYKFSSDDSLSERLKTLVKTDCEGRKSTLSTMKNSLTSEISNLREKKDAYYRINSRVIEKEKEINSLTLNLEDTKNQINDINSLQDSYDKQVKSLNTLRAGTSRLIQVEEEKINKMSDEEHELSNKASKLVNDLKDEEKKYSDLKKDQSKLNDEMKELENSTNSYQRKLSETETKLNELLSKELKNNYELKFKEKEKKDTESKYALTNQEIEGLIEKENQLQKDEKRIRLEKTEIETQISKESEELKSIEQQISDLIIAKTKKEESIKSSYEKQRSKEEEESKISTQKERIRTNREELVHQVEKLKNFVDNIANTHLSKLNTMKKMLTGEINFYSSKKTEVKAHYEELKSKRKDLEAKIEESKLFINTIEKKIYTIRKEQNELDNLKSDIGIKKKERELKINNIKMDSLSYKTEIESITKSLRSSKENFNVYSGLNQEFKEKIDPLKIKLEELKEKKKELEAEIKAQKKRISEKSKALKTETPSAVIMIDMAQDDALNSEKGKKWRKLVDKIIL